MIRTLLAMGALATSIAAAAPAGARDLTIAVRSDYAAPMREALLKPFSEATGVAVNVVEVPVDLDAMKSHAAAGDDGWDLVLAGPALLQMACDQGLLDKLDIAAIGGKDRYPALGLGDCSAGAFVDGAALSWDRDKFAATPTWSDFWDIAKYPGKRGLRRSAMGNLEIALMADGVAPGDVYRTLRGSDGIERAFRKLDQLKPYLSFWQTPADGPKTLGAGDVLMTSAQVSRVATADRDEHRNFGVQWNGALIRAESWGMLKGSPNAASALKLLAFVADPKVAARLAQAGLGPLVKGAVDGLPADQAALSPAVPANQALALVMDTAFWRENGEKLATRFDAWMAR